MNMAAIKDFQAEIRGEFIEDYPLGMDSWFRCGGTADLVFRPADFEDLEAFLSFFPKEEPLSVQGGCVNTIVREGGVRGCVIRLKKPFAQIERVDTTTLKVGCGALNSTLAQVAAKSGIGGLEFLSGIPGTLGGAVRMNAGSYGSETKDVLISVRAIDRQGEIHTLSPEDMKMSYRRNESSEDLIFTDVLLKGHEEQADIVRDHLKSIKEKRQNSQPITEKTGGSTFANPEGYKAWELIDKAGCRGLQIGGAKMSEKHCNFMINTGSANAQDLENLGLEVVKRVQESSCISLRWEIKRVGINK